MGVKNVLPGTGRVKVGSAAYGGIKRIGRLPREPPDGGLETGGVKRVYRTSRLTGAHSRRAASPEDQSGGGHGDERNESDGKLADTHLRVFV